MTVKVLIDKQKNHIIKLTSEGSLRELDQENIGNQLKNLYKAIHNLSHRKFIEDKFSFELDKQKTKYKVLYLGKEQTDRELSELLNERDKLRTDLKDVVRSRSTLVKEKNVYARTTKETIASLEAKMHKLAAEHSEKLKELEKLDKSFKMVSNERDKFKERLKKQKNKRYRVDVNQKLCK
jgi:chromosome segregation ATPase